MMMSSPLLINEPPLQVLPSLAKIIGLNEAIVLQQVHYWLNPQFNRNFFEGRHWVHNTFAQWQKQFSFWSKKTIKRTISTLENSGLLMSFVTRNFKKTKYYTVDYTLLNRISPVGVNSLFLPKVRPEERRKDEDGEIAEKQGSQPWGQVDLLDGANLSPSPEPEQENTPESWENQGDFPWGQNVPSEEDNMTLSMGSECPFREGQLVPLDEVNLTPFHYTEITPENTTEITPLLPLSCPSSACEGGDESQEEEEEEKNKFEFKNTRGNSEQERGMERQNPQDQNLPTNRATEEKKPDASGGGKQESRVRDCQSGTGEDPGAGEIAAQTSIYPLNNRGSKQTQENSTASEMIAVWNRIVQEKVNPGQNAHLTPKRKSLLEKFLHAVFPFKTREEKLDAWKDYCTLIANSRFLAGENPSGFKVSLDWALVPEKAYRVLEGVIYDKPSKPTLNSNPRNPSWEDLEAEIRQSNFQRQACRQLYVEEWLAICKNLAKTLGHAVFKSWFLNTALVELTNDTATIQAETLFMRDYIDSHFRFDIMRSIQAIHPTVTQIKFQVAFRSDGKRGNPPLNAGDIS